jgi:excisionase family DNA binding protein
MTNTPDLTLPDLTGLADVLRNVAALLETTARRRAAPAVDPAPRKRSKGTPARGIEIATPDGLTEREAAKQLGAPKGSYYTGVIRQARRRAANPPGYAVCEAAVAMRLGPHCDLAAIPGEPWCRTHHPDPPTAPAPEPSVRERARLAEAELRWRPDGRALEALYAQSDSFYELTAKLRWHREHVQHLEQLDNDKPRPAWMSVQQAADYAGRSVSSVRTGLARGDLNGTRPRGMKSWSLRPADVDAWLSQEAAGPTPRRLSPRR